jgi:hypothetical protein
MALTARQRNALPRSAFLDPAHRRFPAPTKAQARAAHISEPQRLATLRSALSRAGQTQPRRQRIGGRTVTVKTITPAIARRTVAKRAAGQIASVRPHPAARHRRQAAARRHSQRRRRSRR